MVDPVQENCVEAGIGENDLKAVPGSRISLENSLVILLYIPPEAHGLKPIIHKKSRQLCYYSPMQNGPQTDLLQMIGEYMENGFLENIIDMFRHDTTLYSLVGELIQDERVRVRLGVTALMEELRKVDPDHVILAQDHLMPLLDHTEAVVRGDAANLIGIIGDRKSLPGLKALLDDENGSVRIIAREAVQEIGSDPAQ